jgi:hypothetical protein
MKGHQLKSSRISFHGCPAHHCAAFQHKPPKPITKRTARLMLNEPFMVLANNQVDELEGRCNNFDD